MGMSSITGTSSKRLELVRSTSFKSEADGGKTLEVAMAVTVFKKLQDAGHIDSKAKLADQIAKTATSGAKTYEARLVELIKDTNGNGQLEIDLDALATSGLLTGTHSASSLADVLEGRTVAGTVSDAFIAKQKSDSELTGARGAQVQALSNGMVLNNEVDSAALASLKARASSDPGAVAKEAVAAAQLLTTKGKSGAARTVLESAALALQQAGKFAESRTLFTVLTKEPHAAVPRNLVEDEVGLISSRTRGKFDERTDAMPVTTPAGNKLSIDTRKFHSTVGEAAQLRLDQLALQERMTTTLGRPVDLKSIADASAYFQTFARGRDATAVSKEFGAYLKANFKHSGDGAEWSAKIPQDERAGRLDELLKGQFADDAGRSVIDCEGFAYLSDRLLGGIKNADGSNRFVVEYATRPGHVITGVSEPGTDALFTVNNENVSQPAQAPSQRERYAQIAKELCGKYLNVIGISRKQSQSNPVEVSTLKPPREGSLIWDGDRVRGEIGAGEIRAFSEYSSKAGLNTSFGGFVRDRFE